MEKPKDFPLEEDVEPSSHKSLRLVDLNYYCLREIFKLLDRPSQFAVMQACELFTPIIVDDLWSRYHKTGFNFRSPASMVKRNIEFRSEALKILFKNFTQITNIPLSVLNIFFKDNKDKLFNKVECLSIHGRSYGYHGLDSNDFDRFPNLVRLNLHRLTIRHASSSFLDVENLYMNNVDVNNEEEAIFLRSLFTPNKKTLILKSFPYKAMHYKNLSCISQCVNLRELTIASVYIDDTYVLEPLVNLPSLEILTLERCRKYFNRRNLNLFNMILKKIHANSKKTLEGIQMNGMPNKTFFCSSYLKGIQKLNWMVKTKPDHILTGSDERSHHLPLVLQYYQRFIESNKYLKTLYVRDNQLYRVKFRRYPQFNEDIQSIRVQQNYPRLNIVNDYTNLPENPYIMDLNEGCMKFICNINN